MMKASLYMIAIFLVSGCATTADLQVRVTPVGGVSAETGELYLYALPQTVLKVEVTSMEQRDIPGPYWEYAERNLGITDIIRQKGSRWSIREVTISPFTEPDPQHFYALQVEEGDFMAEYLQPFMQKGIILDGTELVFEEMNGRDAQGNWNQDHLRYLDLGVYGNFEERTETMYKTLVTDTSFVRVPVQRTVVEQKSLAMKAEEAADFLLELRTRRFEMLTGEYEVYPDGEAMAAAIQKLDQLEASYLSLFTGKTVTRTEKKIYFVIPETGSAPSLYRLEMFSEQLGFVPAELMEGLPLELQIQPVGKTAGLNTQFAGTPAPGSLNKLYYRIPDVTSLQVTLGGEVISDQRISIFQSGTMVTSPLK